MSIVKKIKEKVAYEKESYRLAGEDLKRQMPRCPNCGARNPHGTACQKK